MNIVRFCFLIHCFSIFRDRFNQKKREEAWIKIEEAAKNNPTFPQISPFLNNCDSLLLGFNDRFAMIDDEVGDDVLEELINPENKCDTQVLYFLCVN